jgi:hypothetical protein
VGKSVMQGGAAGPVRPGPLRVLLLTALVFLAMAAALPGNFADPYVSFDDYPTLFGWTGTYYSKTLTEGRWVNYLWQEVVGPLDRRVAFLNRLSPSRRRRVP